MRCFDAHASVRRHRPVVIPRLLLQRGLLPDVFGAAQRHRVSRMTPRPNDDEWWVAPHVASSLGDCYSDEA